MWGLERMEALSEGFDYLNYYYRDDPKENYKREALGCFRFGDMVPVWDDIEEMFWVLSYRFSSIVDMYRRGRDRKQEKHSLTTEIINDTFNGLTIEEYEEIRLEALEKICNEEDIVKKIELFENFAEKLIEAGKYFGFREYYDVAHETVVKIDIVVRMLKEGKLSIKDIAYYTGVKLCDASDTAKLLGIDIQLTDEEVEIIREEKERENKKGSCRFVMQEDGEYTLVFDS